MSRIPIAAFLALISLAVFIEYAVAKGKPVERSLSVPIVVDEDGDVLGVLLNMIGRTIATVGVRGPNGEVGSITVRSIHISTWSITADTELMFDNDACIPPAYRPDDDIWELISTASILNDMVWVADRSAIPIDVRIEALGVQRPTIFLDCDPAISADIEVVPAIPIFDLTPISGPFHVQY